MEVAPVGSRWYAWGHHYEVVKQTTRDDEPAVEIRNVDGGTRARKTRTIITRLLDRHGTRTDEGRAA